MSLRRFAPSIAAAPAFAFTGGAGGGSVMHGACDMVASASAIHTSSSQFPTCSRETANAFLGEKVNIPNIFADLKEVQKGANNSASISANIERDMSPDRPIPPIGQARQPTHNFWFEMTTEERSGMDLGLRADRTKAKDGTKKGTYHNVESTRQSTPPPRSASSETTLPPTDPYNDYTAKHEAMQEFYRSCRFGTSAEGSITNADEKTSAARPASASERAIVGGGGGFAPSATANSSTSSNTAGTHASSRRLVHTVRRMRTAHDQMMSRVLPLSQKPQTSVDYFLM